MDAQIIGLSPEKITQSLLAILLIFGVDAELGPLFKSSLPMTMEECQTGKGILMNIAPSATWLEVGVECFENLEAAARFGSSYADQMSSKEIKL